MITLRLLALMAFLLAAHVPNLAAHGPGQHVLGTVTGITGTQLDVTTQKGEKLSILLNEKTQFRPRGASTSGPLPKIGDRVVVETTKEGERLVATEVLFSNKPAPAKPAK
ncbi:hypothetical protein DNFV4_00973 [Nitrospira tepida]|uniref:DUF5666 domain-containing protein n=1 Tax=Nitrospira tepida TaxID=2973512 RepID=A0AA86T2G0_9BACT|nr:hypothetical protein [Nitrospira tepida]CAI4030545.1 hypothetical protein DNFV4_00973 [Nitrospira tepida]